MNRAPAYWPTRIMLAVGFIATAAVLALALSVALPGSPLLGAPGFGDPMFGQPPLVLGLSARVVGSVLGVAPALLGLAWMIRIFRRRPGEPPTWRYRDR